MVQIQLILNDEIDLSTTNYKLHFLSAYIFLNSCTFKIFSSNLRDHPFLLQVILSSDNRLIGVFIAYP